MASFRAWSPFTTRGGTSGFSYSSPPSLSHTGKKPLLIDKNRVTLTKSTPKNERCTERKIKSEGG